MSPGEPLSALGPAAEDSAGSLTGERYGDASDRTNAVTTSAPGEPARLDLDPNAPVSSLPY
ncbi:MAG: hypothetical protein A2V98_14600 [Planctomycetes bacterium RBG_16_64_12]|nr:MAG: hypothetical protein A2V98_14600 [Planctomycetes bacterium RBG_16_64_12]